MDMVTFHTKNKRHIGVYFQDNMISSVQHFLHTAVCQTVAEITVFVHGCYGNHSHVNGCIASCIVGTAISEKHRRIESSPLIYIFSVDTGAMPQVISKCFLVRILFYNLNRFHADGISYVDIFQFISACCKGSVQIFWERAGLAVVYPITTFNNFYCFFSRYQFLFVFFIYIHNSTLIS